MNFIFKLRGDIMSYNTKQRQIILDFLMKNDTHTTAADIEKHLALCGNAYSSEYSYKE